jgi:hypothetical protein
MFSEEDLKKISAKREEAEKDKRAKALKKEEESAKPDLRQFIAAGLQSFPQYAEKIGLPTEEFSAGEAPGKVTLKYGWRLTFSPLQEGSVLGGGYVICTDGSYGIYHTRKQEGKFIKRNFLRNALEEKYLVERLSFFEANPENNPFAEVRKIFANALEGNPLNVYVV